MSDFFLFRKSSGIETEKFDGPIVAEASSRGTRQSGAVRFAMETYVLVVAGFGVLVLLTAWLPMVLRALPLSLPICCVGLGAALSAIPALADITPIRART